MYQLVVIDDEIRVLNGIVKSFPWKEWGFKVVNSFNNSLKALNYLEKYSVDVVLTDIYMPGMNGIELAEKLQEVQPKTNVVFISGFRDFEFAKKAIQLGVRQYVTKPLCQKEVFSAFKEIKQDLDRNQDREGSPNVFFTGDHFSLNDRPFSYHDKVILLTKRYVEENIDSASLMGAAEHIGLSPGYLSKLFKQKTNRSFSDYLLQIRLIRGIQLLDDVKLRVYEVANKVGYKYQKNFSREFRRYFGITPSEYREGIPPVKGLNETEKKYFIKKLTLLFISFLVPVIFVSSIFSSLIIQKTKQEMLQKVPAMVEGLKENVESVFDTTGHIPVMLENHPNVKLSIIKMLEQTSISYAEMYGFNILNTLIDIPLDVNFYIDSVYVYVNNDSRNFIVSGLGVRSIDDYLDHEWYDRYLNLNNNKRLLVEKRNIKNYDFEQTPERVISLFNPISGGVMVTNIRMSYLDNLLSQHKTFNGEIILVAKPSGDILVANEQIDADLLTQILAEETNVSAPILFENNSYFIHSYYSNQYDLFFLSILPKSKILSLFLKEIITVIICVVLVSFVLALIIAYFQVRRDFKELYNIIALFKNAEKGLIQERGEYDEHNVYSLIQNKIVQTFISQSYLKMQLSKRIYKQKIAELTALQLQINPHFLFNTLQTISFEVGIDSGDKQQARDIIQKLSLLLEYSLQDSKIPVTLEQEIYYSNLYCTIQKFRFGDQFEIIWEYSPEHLNLPFSRMIFQPLIENSLVHGIMPKQSVRNQSPGMIKIKIFQLKERLEIRIIDNGIGMKRQKLLDIQRELKREDPLLDGENIGLINTSYRLALKYGEESRIKIKSKEGFGTLVRFSIPL